MPDLDTPGDALPLLAYKIAPRQFDLSYRFSNISLRDQIVRAQTLVRTLINTGLVIKNADEPDAKFQLLICGAGAAGLAAAKEAEALGISFVLVEKGKDVPGGVLRSKATRYVSTAMYEWPHPNHAQHHFPLPDPALLGNDATPLPSLALPFDQPVLIKEFGSGMLSALAPNILAWGKNFLAYHAGGSLSARHLLVTEAELSKKSKRALKAMLKGKVSIHGVPLCEESLPPVELDFPTGTFTSQKFRFDYVIYAVGFAKEALTYAGKKKPYKGFLHSPFWETDALSEPRLGFINQIPRVGILGSGDGALQDALRCLVKPEFEHPLNIWNGLMACKQNGKPSLLHSPHVRTALAKVAAADGYTTGGAIWSHQTHMFKSLDAAFGKIADDLIGCETAKLQHAVNSLIRDDVEKVSIVTQYGYFSKAYALNRFLVILFDKLLATPGDQKKVKLEILSGEVTEFKKIGTNCRGAKLKLKDGSGLTASLPCDLILIRGGLDRSSPPMHVVGLSEMDTGRAGLGRIPAPIRPISIS